MDTQQQTAELVATFGQTLATLSPEAIARLYVKKDHFTSAVGDIATKLSQPEPVAPPPPSAHNTIRIKFSAGGRQYIACGFLKTKESSVKGDEMLGRTDQVEGTKPIDDEEWAHLYRHRAEFPSEFQGKYYMVTARRSPDFPQNLSYFYWDGKQWCEDSNSVGSQWSGSVLVLRRCT